jgi:hypothetical protein
MSLATFKKIGKLHGGEKVQLATRHGGRAEFPLPVHVHSFQYMLKIMNDTQQQADRRAQVAKQQQEGTAVVRSLLQKV